jgi:hypothetical protein
MPQMLLQTPGLLHQPGIVMSDYATMFATLSLDDVLAAME